MWVYEMTDDEFPLEGSLDELINTPTLKWIFVGGKGGVGKTTTSCAIATKLAEKRESVLLLSTDPAHNLSDALTQKFSSTPTLVKGFSNLYAMEIDSKPHEATEFNLNASKEANDFAKFLPEIIHAVPGIDEALSFAELMQ
ncbi:arsenical pump-driving ATPase, putative [Eimeria necatrix]|uniref:Arsenical pump-driving ATPase, putative n=1 Tax=Eimeria necatrix TaxID=51315 RepID=U6MJ62_9EIME|nr:arsenical pump-driving ATPase, putative [Eimeria necatrix]CDJ64282.1 arsenical pump-driving ATPase, putative [Eimeria necatrix]